MRINSKTFVRWACNSHTNANCQKTFFSKTHFFVNQKKCNVRATLQNILGVFTHFCKIHNLVPSSSGGAFHPLFQNQSKPAKIFRKKVKIGQNGQNIAKSKIGKNAQKGVKMVKKTTQCAGGPIFWPFQAKILFVITNNDCEKNDKNFCSVFAA